MADMHDTKNPMSLEKTPSDEYGEVLHGEQGELKRDLKNRHMSMIAIGTSVAAHYTRCLTDNA